MQLPTAWYFLGIRTHMICPEQILVCYCSYLALAQIPGGTQRHIILENEVCNNYGATAN